VNGGEEDANAAASAGGAQACDGVGNCADSPADIAGNKVDRKAPTVSFTEPAGDGTSFYVLNASVSSSFECADGGSGVAPVDGCDGPGTIDTSSVGSKVFGVSTLDQVGNAGTGSTSYVVQYSGGSCLGSPGHQVLQPVNPDGSSAFKKGSTVPIKFRVCDALGTSIPDPELVTSFKLVKKVSGTVESVVLENPTSTTPDTAFRWDATAQQWIFNLSTKNLAGNYTYYYAIDLNDGTKITFHFYLKN
jgi:hypothetical protein